MCGLDWQPMLTNTEYKKKIKKKFLTPQSTFEKMRIYNTNWTLFSEKDFHIFLQYFTTSLQK